MFWSLAPLVIACILLAGLVGMCSFQPGSANKVTIPAYDATGPCAPTPRRWASRSGYRSCPQGGGPTRAAVGSSERANRSGDRSAAQRGHLGRGIHQPDGHVPEPDPEQRGRGQAGGLDPPAGVPTGAVQVDGTNWVVYQGAGQSGADAEPVWTTRLTGPAGATQLAITGAGNADQFRTLAAATQSQPPLPAR